MGTIITRKMYGWTKYGGGRKGTVQEELDEWVCQSCGEKHTKELPYYILPMDSLEREFVKVCSVCKYVSEVAKVREYYDLIKITRDQAYRNLANLMSLSAKISHG